MGCGEADARSGYCDGNDVSIERGHCAVDSVIDERFKESGRLPKS